MKRDGKYKFNLQFPSETEEQIRAGELLEKLGHQKSAVVVDALNAYILQHPELLGNSFKIEYTATLPLIKECWSGSSVIW